MIVSWSEEPSISHRSCGREVRCSASNKDSSNGGNKECNRRYHIGGSSACSFDCWTDLPIQPRMDEWKEEVSRSRKRTSAVSSDLLVH
ncbi:hypothetical protein HNY73_005705 [Argiope bruennichi]|uniref:Uncharacterized protein n=1 Tax=Argiope bruennichi TaxID=94029 RepID=A0A8T0FMD4_ARGBR|nr:hypothetical protein HNY73_005705 [Argiope bruennichi]